MEENGYYEKVSIVLLSYKGAEDTIECIGSLMNLNNKNINILIVDNCSPDDTVKKLETNLNELYKDDFKLIKYDSKIKKYSNSKANSKIILILNDKNAGFSAGNNVGIRFSRLYLKNKYIWILNNDTIVEKNNIDYLTNEMKRYNDNAMIGSTIMEYYDKDIIQRVCGNKYNSLIATKKTYYNGYSINDIDKIKPKFDYIAGCSVFTTDKILNSIGDMSEEFFLYYEDVDLSMKAKKNKIGLYWCKNSIVYHKHGASIGGANIKRKKNYFSEYQADYNALVYNKKWYKLMAFIPSFNRFLIKYILFKIKKEKEMNKALINAYKDFYTIKKSSGEENV